MPAGTKPKSETTGSDSQFIDSQNMGAALACRTDW